MSKIAKHEQGLSGGVRETTRYHERERITKFKLDTVAQAASSDEAFTKKVFGFQSATSGLRNPDSSEQYQNREP